MQLVAEADLHDLKVARKDIEFAAQRNFLMRSRGERQAQHVAQTREHFVRGADIALHQRRDAVERIEKKVRVQLRLQRGELRFR